MHKTEQLLADAQVTDEFSDLHERELAMAAILGKDVEDWMSGDVGRWVIGCAIQDQRDIEQKIVQANVRTPWGRRNIAKLQQRHAAVGMAVEWLRDAVVVGGSALQELNRPYDE